MEARQISEDFTKILKLGEQNPFVTEWRRFICAYD